MRKLRWIGTSLVALAGVVVAADQDTVPRQVRAAAIGVLLVATALGIPAAQGITRRAAAKDEEVK